MILTLPRSNQEFTESKVQKSISQVHQEGARGHHERDDNEDGSDVLLKSLLEEERDVVEDSAITLTSNHQFESKSFDIYLRCAKISKMIEDGKNRRASIAEKISYKPEPFKARPLPSFFHQTLDNSTFMERNSAVLNHWNSQGKAKREKIEAKLSSGVCSTDKRKNSGQNKPATDDVHQLQPELLSEAKANKLFLKLYKTQTKNNRSKHLSSSIEDTRVDQAAKHDHTKLSHTKTTDVTNRLYSQTTISYKSKKRGQNDLDAMMKKKKKGAGAVKLITEKEARMIFSRLHNLQTKSCAAKKAIANE